MNAPLLKLYPVSDYFCRQSPIPLQYNISYYLTLYQSTVISRTPSIYTQEAWSGLTSCCRPVFVYWVFYLTSSVYFSIGILVKMEVVALVTNNVTVLYHMEDLRKYQYTVSSGKDKQS